MTPVKFEKEPGRLFWEMDLATGLPKTSSHHEVGRSSLSCVLSIAVGYLFKMES